MRLQADSIVQSFGGLQLGYGQEQRVQRGLHSGFNVDEGRTTG
jgi:hypothetical protein